MKKDMMKLAELFVDKIKRDYKDDVAIVHVHGSYAYDDAHDRSDLDMYFVPKTQRGKNLACTFILDGIGCDLFCVLWERLEKMASHGEKIASIVTEGKLLYYSSEEDLARFELLRERTLDKGDRSEWLSRARRVMDDAYKDAFTIMNAQTLSEIRTGAIGLIYSLSFVLAQLNQITIKRGRKLLKQEILAMPLSPRDFGRLYDSVFSGNDIGSVKAACIELVQNTEALVSKALAKPPVTFQKLFAGWYEEMMLRSKGKVTAPQGHGKI